MGPTVGAGLAKACPTPIRINPKLIHKMKATASVIITTAALLLAGCDVPAPPQQASTPDPVKPWQDYGKEAYAVARRMAESSLKAPATAKFSSPGFESYGFNQWKVGGVVDSQNSFGALIRNHWQAVVRRDGYDFEVVYLRVGDVVSGKMPEVSVAPPPQPTAEELSARSSAAAERLAKVRAAELKHHQDLAARPGSLRSLSHGKALPGGRRRREK